MDRQIVYVGAVPLDTDQLFQTRATMTAIGYLAKMTVGDGSTVVDGFACVPAGGLAVEIAPGSMTLPTVIDIAAYGSLPPDTDPLVKIGINSAPTLLPISGTGGWAISACVVETQAGSAALTYYNTTNPIQTLVGLQGNGQAQASVVQQRVLFQVTAVGAVPAGYTALWQVMVPDGISAISQSMISMAPGAPFLSVKLPQAAPLQSPNFVGIPTTPTAPVGDASAIIASTAFVAVATGRNRAAWGAGGAHAWTCPSGVNRVLVRLWGAGGAGGSAANGFSGGGGGGGGYVEALIYVSAGMTYAIQVGSGTSGSSASSFGSTISVAGGSPGGTGQSSGYGVGGACGTPSAPEIDIVASLGVAPGAGGFQIGNTNVGGAGGSSFGVASAQPAFGRAIGFDGLWPGGGGGGGSTDSGGNGADGLVLLEWTG